jgi:PAS domain S-box-containing protein
MNSERIQQLSPQALIELARESHGTEYLDHFERFCLAVDCAADHIIMTDPDGVIIYANHAAEVTTGYSVDEMVGQTPSLWGRQMSREYYETLWGTIRDKKQHYYGEVQNKRRMERCMTLRFT